jgi:hypothetical protein
MVPTHYGAHRCGPKKSSDPQNAIEIAMGRAGGDSLMMLILYQQYLFIWSDYWSKKKSTENKNSLLIEMEAVSSRASNLDLNICDMVSVCYVLTVNNFQIF